MRSFDLWLASLLMLISAACWSSKHLDIPDKAEIIPSKAYSENIPFKALVEKESPLSACELEVEFLRSEASSWRDKYTSCKEEDQLDDTYTEF